MPPKGFPGVSRLIAKMGTRVYIDYPKQLIYDIMSSDNILSVAIAINNARHTYCNLDWSKVTYATGKFMYQEKQIEK